MSSRRSCSRYSWPRRRSASLSLPCSRDFFYSLVHPDDRAKVRAAADQSRDYFPSAPLEYRIVRPGGEERVVYRENDVVLDEAGQPVRRFSVFKDITDAHAARQRETELQWQLMRS